MPLHFSVFGMFIAVVVGIAAAAWVEHEREVSQRKRRVARVVDEAEAASLWEHGEPTPTAVPRLEASSADARVAAAVTRAAEAEAEAMQLALALEETRRNALSDEDAWTELSSTLGESARCSQCRGGVRTHVLVPCGHSCCGDCAARGDEACVLCGAAIQYPLQLKD